MKKQFFKPFLIWLAWASAALGQGTYELTFSHFFSTKQGSHTDIILPWVEELESRSEGQISVSVRGRDSWLGNVAQQYDQAETGLADISLGLAAVPQGRFECTQVAELPYVFESAAQIDQLLLELFPEFIGHEYDTVKLLGLWSHEPGVLLTRGVRIERPEDLVGLRIGFPNEVLLGLLTDLGAEPVRILPGSLRNALKNGEIDGAFVPWEHIWFADLSGPDTYVFDLGAYSIPLYLIMNNITYDQLPTDLQSVVDSVSLENWYQHNGGVNRGVFWGKDPDMFYADVKVHFVEAGGTLVVPDDPLRQIWLDAAKPSLTATKARLAHVCGAGLIRTTEAFLERW